MHSLKIVFFLLVTLCNMVSGIKAQDTTMVLPSLNDLIPYDSIDSIPSNLSFGPPRFTSSSILTGPFHPELVPPHQQDAPEFRGIVDPNGMVIVYGGPTKDFTMLLGTRAEFIHAHKHFSEFFPNPEHGRCMGFSRRKPIISSSSEPLVIVMVDTSMLSQIRLHTDGGDTSLALEKTEAHDIPIREKMLIVHKHLKRFCI